MMPGEPVRRVEDAALLAGRGRYGAEAALSAQEPVASVLDAAAAQVRAAVPRPFEDIHATTASFRLHLAEVLTRRAGGAP
jgi:CO/xanthine dehydrogenase FAD-binding subunit